MAAGIANAVMFSPMAVLIPFLLRHTFHDGKVFVGYTFAVIGLAGAIGALVASNLKTPRRRVRVMWTFWTISSLSGLIIGFATNFWEVMIFPIVASPLLLLGNVIWESMMQTEVPRELLGRASAPSTGSCRWDLAPIGLVVAGSLATAWGVRTYFVVVSLVSARTGRMDTPLAQDQRGRRGTASRDRQLRRHRQRHPHEARALLRRTWVYNLRSKRPALGFADPSPAHLDPLVVRRFVHDVGHEDPVLTSFFDAVDDDGVAGAHAVPTASMRTTWP